MGALANATIITRTRRGKRKALACGVEAATDVVVIRTYDHAIPQSRNEPMVLQIQKLSVVITSAAAITLVGCGAESAVAVAPVAKATPTLLTPVNADDGVVVGKMLQLNCGEGLKPISLPSLRSAAKVGDTGVRYTSTHSIPSGVTYEFTGALPEVRAAIVRFLKKPGSVIIGYESGNPSALDFRAAWPQSAETEPVKLLVQSLSFSDSEMTVGSITLCTT